MWLGTILGALILVLIAVVVWFRPWSTAQQFVPIPQARVTSPTAPAIPTPEDPFHELTRHRAHLLWIEAGQPTGETGKEAQGNFWFKAEAQVKDEAEKRAYAIWENNGKPTGEIGESLKDVFWRQAVDQLLEVERTKRLREESREAKPGMKANPVTEF
jgi:hypothetical protein